jgi:TonB family protein
MLSASAGLPEVFSVRETARAAGVSATEVRALIAAGEISSLDGRYLSAVQATRAVRVLCEARMAPGRGRDMFEAASMSQGRGSIPLVASGALHAAVLAAFLFATTWGVTKATVDRPAQFKAVRLVFLATPGPGGGGGGGGLHQPAPPPKAEQKGVSPLRSPVPMERTVRQTRVEPAVRRAPAPPPPIAATPRPADPPPPVVKPNPIPPVVAPVVSAPADTRERAGVLTESPAQANSQGPGIGGGAGTGSGTGIGEGSGPGIGPGSGGGTGGGPYRPGSGITPPGLLREIKPDYTEDARRRGIAGEVVLEIIVRSDGSVGQVRVVQGLGSGLDERAVDAVRQWRFSPARRYGTPVDVIVEVAVAFKLR